MKLLEIINPESKVLLSDLAKLADLVSESMLDRGSTQAFAKSTVYTTRHSIEAKQIRAIVMFGFGVSRQN